MRVKRFSFQQIGNGQRVPWHVLLVLPSSLFVYFQSKICGSTFFGIIPSAGLTKKAPIATTYGISGQGTIETMAIFVVCYFFANFISAADRWQRHPDVPDGCFFSLFWVI
jgi:hypothetical protein